MPKLTIQDRMRLLVPIVTDEHRAAAHESLKEGADCIEALTAERDALKAENAFLGEIVAAYEELAEEHHVDGALRRQMEARKARRPQTGDTR